MDGAFVIVIAFTISVLLTCAAIAGTRVRGKLAAYSLSAIGLMVLGAVGITMVAKSPSVHREASKSQPPGKTSPVGTTPPSDPSVPTPRHGDVASNP